MDAFCAVRTTGIYCRPDCNAHPKPENVRAYEFAAAAEAAGFRPCLRCRPYRTSRPMEWSGPELVCRAVQLVLRGALDDGTEAELGTKLGISSRHLRRLFAEHVGATPDQLARSRRAHFARRLLDDTDLTVTDVAFASGFGSVRQLNRACQEIFRSAPTELRARRRKHDRLAADGGLVLRLPHDGRLDWPAMLRHFGARALPGVEVVEGDVYRRTIVVDGDPGVLEFRPGGDDHLLVTAHLPHWEGLIHVIERARSIFSLDAPLDEPNRVLAGDDLLGPLVTAHPDRRVPGAWDAYEIGVRIIIGQQVSVAGARTVAGRLVAAIGKPVPGLDALGLTHTFPPADVLASADLGAVGLTRARGRAIQTFASAVVEDRLPLDGRAPLDEMVAAVTELPGLGPWTAHHLALRIGERDAFPVTDLGLLRTYERLAPADDVPLGARAERWAPWRAAAATHLFMADRIDATGAHDEGDAGGASEVAA